MVTPISKTRALSKYAGTIQALPIIPPVSRLLKKKAVLITSGIVKPKETILQPVIEVDNHVESDSDCEI